MNSFQYLVLDFGDEGRPSKTAGLLLSDYVLILEQLLSFMQK
jgi:hypothetical protein